jgi:hypothetical protein
MVSESVRWLSVNSFRYDGTRWVLREAPPLDVRQLSGLPRRTGGQSRKYLVGLDVRASDATALCVIMPRGDYKQGCRGAGALMAELLSEFGATRLPSKVFIGMAEPYGGRIQARFLAPIALMASAERRKAFMRRHQLRTIPEVGRQSAKAYENHAFEMLATDISDRELWREPRLFTSKPDGVAIDRHKREALIIEVKKGKPDLVEGASQIMLYSEQVRVLPQYAGLDPATLLITNTPTPGQDYRMWQEFMASDQEIEFFVADSAIEPNVSTTVNASS